VRNFRLSNSPKIRERAAPFLIRIAYDAAQNKDSDLYSELRGKELFQSANCVAVTDALNFDPELLAELNELWSSSSEELIEFSAGSAHPRTKQIIWPGNLLKLKSDLSSIDENEFNLSFKSTSLMAALDTRLVVAIAPEYSMVTRSFLDALLMLACGKILDNFISSQGDGFWLDTGTATQILRKHVRVVYYNFESIPNQRQFVKLGHYLDTALLRMSDRFCRALRRDDNNFLNKFRANEKKQVTALHN